MVPPPERGPAELLAAGDQVDPRDRVAVQVIVGDHPFEQRVEVRHPLVDHQDVLRLDRDQIEGGPQDETGEAHPADRRPPQVGIGRRRDHADAPVGQQHLDLADVGPERAVDVVALAVDVAGDRTPDRDESRTRRAPARTTPAG